MHESNEIAADRTGAAGETIQAKMTDDGCALLYSVMMIQRRGELAYRVQMAERHIDARE